MTTLSNINQQWKPNLFIAGFNKCGTTELCDYLSQHPDIFLPYEKEPNTFYDLAKYPACFSGDPTGNARHYITSLNDLPKLYSKGKKYKYRIDGTVSYTFDPKFPSILKSFSESAKIILMVRNQHHRLASVYFHSFLNHREKDFAKWFHDYFIPYFKTFLCYDKVAAYYNEFGDNNLRIIETKNLSSEDEHEQIFEYLGLKPVKINVRHKNPNLVGPEDSKAYRQLILTLASIKLRTLGVAQRIGLSKEAIRASYVIGDLGRELFKKRHDNTKQGYSNIIKLIPDDISSMLDVDYRKTLDFAIQKRIMIRPPC
jgi:Sulfotransferase domain